MITLVKKLKNHSLQAQRGVLCFNWPPLLYLCSFWSTVWNRSHRKWPCRPSCQRRQIIPLTKKQPVFLLIFSPSLRRSCCFCIPPNIPDGPLFKSCYLSYWEGMKRRPGVSRWSLTRPEAVQTPALRKNLPGGLRYSGPLSLPVFWPCWKFRENSAWMKTRSIFTFPLKGVSVLSSSQAYHLPLQTHLKISLATRRWNMQKISDHVDSNSSWKSKRIFRCTFLWRLQSYFCYHYAC